ncbi:MAG TPA: DevR family CRISPR-associated autoregulator [Nitrospira sp.]|nr:DevR family CRISPR-associated autoregulator [Nitrospira sp.]
MSVHSLSLCARVTLDLHSLNNEGTEGNQQQTRMVHIIDQRGQRAVVNAISGDMLKHIIVGHLVPLLEEANEPLSQPARRLDPDRITADASFLEIAQNHDGSNADLLTEVLRRCSLTDLAGALFVDAALPRKSCIEFGWVVGLPTDATGAPVTTTEQYFHVKYAAERGGAAGGETTVGKQPIFHRPASSGIYALICNLDLYRIGLNDITRQYVIEAPNRQARARALVHALAATILKPAGAQRNTQNPHIVACEGVIAVSSNSFPAPTVSPLNDNYREQIEQAAAVLNRIKPNGVTVRRFATLAKGLDALADVTANLQVPGA